MSVTDGRIAEIGDARGEPPSGALDLAARTLMPGLIDAHAHLSSDVSRSPGFGPRAPLKGEGPRPRELGYFVLANAAREFLRAGVTTVRDVESYDDEGIVLRRAVELGLLNGPRILCCGRIISATAPGGRIFGTMYREADGPWEMRAAVREQIGRGADFVEADGDRRPLGRARGSRAGADDPRRARGDRRRGAPDGPAGRSPRGRPRGRPARDRGGRRHGRARALASPGARAPRSHGRARHGPRPATLSTFHDLAERFSSEFVPALVDQAERQREEAYRTLVAAHEAGVTLAMGFDSGPPGANVLELVRMAEGGLNASEAIRAATEGSARALGLADVGTVEPTKLADLVVVDGDPLADVRVLTDPARIWLVLKEGRAVAGAALETGAVTGL